MSSHLDPGVRLGAEVRHRRELAGLSRPQLAEQSRVSMDSIVKLERGHTINPGVFTLRSLARVLGSSLDQLLAAAEGRPTPPTPLVHDTEVGLVSIGYENRTVDDLSQELRRRRVTVLADVRLTPLSRKAGLSKTRLSERMASEGITYKHYRQLGNPKDNRSGFGREAGPAQRYEAILRTDAAAADIAAIGALASTEKVAVLCFERLHEHCHRAVLLDAVRRDFDVAMHRA